VMDRLFKKADVVYSKSLDDAMKDHKTAVTDGIGAASAALCGQQWQCIGGA
jgi:hypothetical protein